MSLFPTAINALMNSLWATSFGDWKKDKGRRQIIKWLFQLQTSHARKKEKRKQAWLYEMMQEYQERILTWQPQSGVRSSSERTGLEALGDTAGECLAQRLSNAWPYLRSPVGDSYSFDWKKEKKDKLWDICKYVNLYTPTSVSIFSILFSIA